MADAPEIPEANNPFEKRVAVTIAILAVVLAVVGNKGDNAKTDAIISTNLASNKWSHYQSKSLKEGLARVESSILSRVQLSDSAKDIAEHRDSLAKLMKRYEDEQVDIKKEAEDAQKDAERGSKINDRCDQGSLALQIAIVIASVSILARSRAFWIGSIALGLVGIVVGVMAFLI